MSALVSIIIPTYNGEKYVEKTINSCISQFHSNLEIIIIDDCSTDNTREILKKFTDSRIQIFYNETNLGISKNVNLGASRAKGEYITLLGHDDMLPPFHVQNMLREFAPEIGVVYCEAAQINGDDEIIKFKTSRKRNKICKNPMQYLALKTSIQSAGLVVKKDVFDKVGGWDEEFSFCSEWFNYIKYAEITKFAYAQKTFAFYRVHETNISKDIGIKHLKEFREYCNRCRKRAFASANKTPALIWRYYLRKLKVKLGLTH